MKSLSLSLLFCLCGVALHAQQNELPLEVPSITTTQMQLTNGIDDGILAPHNNALNSIDVAILAPSLPNNYDEKMVVPQSLPKSVTPNQQYLSELERLKKEAENTNRIPKP